MRSTSIPLHAGSFTPANSSLQALPKSTSVKSMKPWLWRNLTARVASMSLCQLIWRDIRQALMSSSSWVRLALNQTHSPWKSSLWIPAPGLKSPFLKMLSNRWHTSLRQSNWTSSTILFHLKQAWICQLCVEALSTRRVLTKFQLIRTQSLFLMTPPLAPSHFKVKIQQ